MPFRFDPPMNEGKKRRTCTWKATGSYGGEGEGNKGISQLQGEGESPAILRD
jgi:hypothetical protein